VIISMPSIEVDNAYRRRLAIYMDRDSPPGTLATRKELRAHHEQVGESEDDDIWMETNDQYEAEQKGRGTGQ